MLINKKKLVFVCYGGGHIELVKSVIPILVKEKIFEIILIPLTTAVKALPKEGIEGVRIIALPEFIHLFDENIDQILEYGLSLFEENYNPVLGLRKSDTIFYLGLSLFDAVTEYGKERALDRYKKMGRQSFLPVESLKTIFKFLNPDLVFTTNSPRFEAAALAAAKELKIKSMQLLDLFGDGYPLPSADYIGVLNESVVNKLKNKGIEKEILPVGQPVFDDTVKQVKEIDSVILRNKLNIPSSSQLILFCPTLYYVWNDNLTIKEIRDLDLINQPMFRILNQLIETNNVSVLLRPHPVSDSINNYLPYIQDKKGYYYYDNSELGILEAIALCDLCLTYNSTVAVQALVCDKKVVTYNYDPDQNYFWPEFTQPPFKYAPDYEALNAVLSQTIKEEINKQEYDHFYKNGAAHKILDILKDKLWSS
ncbi:CDP-glycerol glycerophosphotransferase family protein [Pedobacter montanisoli]|uniref:CDP-glycerol glycerophosphotransferase family protein n=1 Tax=Pedobacter montanisoli TaxID=2923277 RepID=A0ABS9ZSC9_9SPHI|nr:CDP-glycerol glycerophosphotransferase family protein [Pedobacter montanisoli]MCJ0741497.1 CDP-glycerol glycerophosphotransferase family protein [Pedobacter montanisoli]